MDTCMHTQKHPYTWMHTETHSKNKNEHMPRASMYTQRCSHMCPRACTRHQPTQGALSQPLRPVHSLLSAPCPPYPITPLPSCVQDTPGSGRGEQSLPCPSRGTCVTSQATTLHRTQAGFCLSGHRYPKAPTAPCPAAGQASGSESLSGHCLGPLSPCWSQRGNEAGPRMEQKPTCNRSSHL